MNYRDNPKEIVGWIVKNHSLSELVQFSNICIVTCQAATNQPLSQSLCMCLNSAGIRNYLSPMKNIFQILDQMVEVCATKKCKYIYLRIKNCFI